MAIYRLSLSAVSRKSGRSTVAAAAYRAAERLTDLRDGRIHDYSRRKDVEDAILLLPGGSEEPRAAFWNRVEAHHKRGDAVTGRELVIALPAELDGAARRELAVSYGRELAERYGVAADVALHSPHKGDDRNYHAHILMSACRVEVDGTLGKKVAELDPIHCSRHGLENAADRERARWEALANAMLERQGEAARIDHRTRAAQEQPGPPEPKLGPAVVAIERRAEREAVVDGRVYQPVTDAVRRQTALRGWRAEVRDKLKAVRDWWTQHVVLAPAPPSTAGMAAALEQVQREQRERQAAQEAARAKEAAAALERQRQVAERQEPQRQAEVKRPVQTPDAPVLRPKGPRL